jgi:hypothetical protein
VCFVFRFDVFHWCYDFVSTLLSLSAIGQPALQIDIAQKAKDLFGEETVHLVDED